MKLIMASNKQVKDGFLIDLPEDIQRIVMNIHKLLISTCDDVWKDSAYDSIRNEEWAKSAIDEFCTKPSNNSPIGSVRVYKQGKRNSCMIQLTGHVTNHRNDINHELLHDFFRHVHQDMKAKVRRQFNMKLTCESEHGEPFDGFDIWTDSKIAKSIWDLFDDKKIKKIKEMKESSAILAVSYLARAVNQVDDDDYGGIEGTHNIKSGGDMGGDMTMMGESVTERMFAEMDELPEGLQDFITNLNIDITESMLSHIGDDKYSYMIESDEFITADMIIESYYGTSDSNEIGNVTLWTNSDGSYNGYINVTTECYNSDDPKFNKLMSNLYKTILKECKIVDDYTKDLFILESGNSRSFNINLDPEYAAKLWNYLEKVDPIQVFEEKKTKEEYARAAFKKKYKYDPKDSTIEVDGKRIKVDMDNSTLILDDNKYILRETLSSSSGGRDDNKIILDNDFFKLKDPKRRDAILRHEIGHLKMHLAKGSDRKFRSYNYTVDHRDEFDRMDKSKDDKINELRKQYIDQINKSEIAKDIPNEVINKIVDDFVNAIKDRDKSFEKHRDDFIKYAKKYIRQNENKHNNVKELEADRYGANKTSTSTMKRSLRELYKHASKSNYSKKFIKAYKKKTGEYPDFMNNIVFELTDEDYMDEYLNKLIKKYYPNVPKDEDGDYDYEAIPADIMKKVQTLYMSKAYGDAIKNIDNAKKSSNKTNRKEYELRSKALSDKKLALNPIYKEAFEDCILFDPFMEANNEKSEYNTDMTEGEAKKTLRALSQDIINDIASDSKYQVTQYKANTYANIISKNLLPLWAKGFRKVSISLDSYQSFPTLEFKIPKMTQDFVSRFINGRESINGLLHRNPEIQIKMSPRIFHTMKNPDDAFNFFRAAIKYYDTGIEKYSDKLMVEAMKLNHEMKHLISTTKLSGIITCPMQLLFIFDNVEMSNKDTFKISQENIKTVNQFIRNIYTRYAAPEKEKKQIVEDINKMVKALKESCDKDNENIKDLNYLPESVDKYFSNKFDNEIQQHNEVWIRENFDMDWIYRQKNPEVKYLQEKFGVKKLKKIPADIVAYITIETESIRDNNDKMMISSYCLSKIEIVEWYITLLEVGSKKYIVPHQLPYLKSLRTQLLACFKKIMETKIPNPNNRPLIDIQYPKGYEG